MLINIDAKQLEWVVACYWSQDPTGMEEILSGFDQHSDNQGRFKLPTRTVAKIFLFRIIYGGSAYSFSVDPKFGNLGGESWWDEKITQFYEKYSGLHRWHTGLLERVIKSGGVLELPTGRAFEFSAGVNKWGEQVWPRTKILNYPVQGTAADIISIARVSLYKRLYERLDTYKFVNTVHDSIVLDTSENSWDNIREVIGIIHKVFEDIPSNFQKLFGIELNLPIRCDITIGSDWKNMADWELWDQNGGWIVKT